MRGEYKKKKGEEIESLLLWCRLFCVSLLCWRSSLNTAVLLILLSFFLSLGLLSRLSFSCMKRVGREFRPAEIQKRRRSSAVTENPSQKTQRECIYLVRRRPSFCSVAPFIIILISIFVALRCVCLILHFDRLVRPLLVFTLEGGGWKSGTKQR